jgi:hypothetical protein
MVVRIGQSRFRREALEQLNFQDQLMVGWNSGYRKRKTIDLD